jgi:hypothetical protein
MNRISTILTVMVLAVILTAGSVPAYDLGDNITVFDGVAKSASGWGDYNLWWNTQNEDQEVEFMDERGQVWDLEAFFQNDMNLSMVGGFDFKNGVNDAGHVITSGDIFIDVTGDMVYGQNVTNLAGSNQLGLTAYDGNTQVKNVFGYDYVLDMNFPGSTYDIYQIDSTANLKMGYYRQNDASNGWQYVSGGTLVGTGSFAYTTGQTNVQTGLLGGSHNVVSGIDLSFLAQDVPVDFVAHFTMACGNDNLIGKGTLAAVPPPATTTGTPEPATMFLLGSGMMGLAGLRKRFGKKN